MCVLPFPCTWSDRRQILTQIRLQFHKSGFSSRAGSGFIDTSDFLSKNEDVRGELYGGLSAPTRRGLGLRSPSSYSVASIASVGGGVRGGGGGGGSSHPSSREIASAAEVDVSHDMVMELLS